MVVLFIMENQHAGCKAKLLHERFGGKWNNYVASKKGTLLRALILESQIFTVFHFPFLKTINETVVTTISATGIAIKTPVGPQPKYLASR